MPQAIPADYRFRHVREPRPRVPGQRLGAAARLSGHRGHHARHLAAFADRDLSDLAIKVDANTKAINALGDRTATQFRELRGDLAELRTGQTELRGEVTQLCTGHSQLRGDVGQLQGGMAELRIGVGQIITMLDRLIDDQSH